MFGIDSIVKNMWMLKVVTIINEIMKTDYAGVDIDRCIDKSLIKYNQNGFFNRINVALSPKSKKHILGEVYDEWKIVKVEEECMYEHIQSSIDKYRVALSLGFIATIGMNDVTNINECLRKLNINIGYGLDGFHVDDNIDIYVAEIRDSYLLNLINDSLMEKSENVRLREYIEDALYFLYPTSVIVGICINSSCIEVLICDGAMNSNIMKKYDTDKMVDIIKQTSRLYLNKQLLKGR